MPDPLRPTTSGTVRQGAAATRPIAEESVPATSGADRLSLTSGRRAPYRPGPVQDDVNAPLRSVYPWVQQGIDTAVRRVFAQSPPRSAMPQSTAGPSVAAWDPARAESYGNGSLAVPGGRPVPQAPAPGEGRVNPPGLSDGNTVLRWGADGQPENFTVLDQGNTNGCGTTSLAMLLNFFAGGDAVFDREGIDRFIRHYGMFTSPGDIAAFAEQRGFDAAVHTGTTPAELRRMIDAGLPVQLLIDVSENRDGSGLHYEVVTGYGRGPDGKTYYELANPNGRREYMAEEVLLSRWSNLRMAGLSTGIDRVAIALRPPGDKAPLLSDDRGALLDTGMNALRVAQGLTQVTSGWARREPTRLVAGLIRLVVGGLTSLPGLAVHGLDRAGERWMREGSNQVGESLAGTVQGGARVLAGGSLRLVAGPLKAFSAVTSWGADKLATGVERLGSAVAGWLR